jgi:SAM-dependent methyltransferase
MPKGFVTENPSSEARFYDRNALLGTHDESLPRVKAVLELVGRAGNVLDVGPGYGTLSFGLARLGNQVTGLDVTSRAVEHLGERGIPCLLYKANTAFPIPTEAFDAVVASEVLEHVFDTRFFVSEVRRVLRPGGRFVATTPNVASLGCRLSLALGKLPWPIEWNADPGMAGHIRAFTCTELRRLLAEAGLSDITIGSTAAQITPRIRIPGINRILSGLGLYLVASARRPW